MDIAAWLRGLGLERYERTFRDNEIDGEVLARLTADDLKEAGVAAVGHRRRLLDAIATLPLGDGTAGIPAAPPARQAERRQITVMFVDLVGSTALASRLDPEETREVLRAYQNAVTGEVARVDGHVAKLMGDGVLAYFGWPRAHEDDAERAVRAGLGIVAAVPRLTTPAAAPLAARVGVATGLVVVGDLAGEGSAREEAVVGETPNLAARLQEAAAPGTVVVAEGARRLLGEVFALRGLGPLALKGFAQPVLGFAVVGERPAQSRFEARRSDRAAPMVGREQELALVRERWRQAGAGEGQAVLVVGEAGIGKSRLVQAVLEALAGEEHTALRYQCSPYHTGTPLWPVAQQLRLAAGIEAGEGDPAKFAKLVASFGRESSGDEVALMAALLGIECPAAPELSAQQRRARTLAALAGQVLARGRRRPGLVVLEDAHWADPTTLELVGLVLDRIADSRALLLLTSRPDGQPAVGGHPRLTRLALNRLGRGPTEAIVARLTGCGLSLAVQAEIAARTDGVPLFIEELTRAVLEAGAEAGAATVPASLHASLMARLDRVPGVKEVAQVASCLGREFAYPLLAAVSPLTEPELRAALERLAAAELVFARGEPPEAAYTFKHALVRDAAHASLLRTRRRELHARIVAALEERFPETAETEPEPLARHCVEAGLIAEAVGYWHRAGRQAVARSAMAEAIGQLNRGLELLAGLPDDAARQRLELELQTALGGALIAAKGWAAEETGAAVARARELCRMLGETPQLFPVMVGQWSIHFNRGEIERSVAVGEDLLRLAQVQEDLAARVMAHRNLGCALLCLGRLAPARSHLEQVLALYDPAQHGSLALRYMHLDPWATGSNWHSWTLLTLGYPDQAQARAPEALAYARSLSHGITLSICLFQAAGLCQLRRDRSGALGWADELIALAIEQGQTQHLALGNMFRGWALAVDGDQGGLSQIRQGLAAYRGTGGRSWLTYFLALLAEAQGSTPEALATLEEALAQAERIGERWFLAELYRRKGTILLALSPSAAGEDCLQRALAIARGQKARMWELRAAVDIARLRQTGGRRREASALLEPIHSWFTEGFATPDLRAAKALLAELGEWTG